MLYVDQGGLANGTQYYYQAKSAYPNPVTGLTTLSSPTLEDSEAPDPNGVPWDSKNANAILNKVAAQDSRALTRFRAMGPDGAIYDTYYGEGPLTNDLSWDSASRSIRDLRNPGRYNATAPSYNPDDELVAQLLSDAPFADLSEPPVVQTTPVFISRSGPIRKILSDRGYRGVSGTVTLPSFVSLATYTYPGNEPIEQRSTGDTPYIYFGGTFARRRELNASNPAATQGGAEIDAGLGYMTLKYGSSAPRRVWRAIILSHNYDSSDVYETKRETMRVLGVSEFPGFFGGENVSMSFGIYSTNMGTTVPDDPGQGNRFIVRLSALSVVDPSNGTRPYKVVLYQFVKLAETDTAIDRLINTVEMKQIESLAQDNLQGDDRARGYRFTGSSWYYAALRDVHLTAANPTGVGPSVPWTAARCGQLVGATWPLQTGNARVEATALSAFSDTTNIGFDLSPRQPD